MRPAVRASKTFRRLAASETLNGCSLAAFSRRLIEADIRCAPVEYASILWPAVFLRLRPEHQRGTTSPFSKTREAATYVHTGEDGTESGVPDGAFGQQQ